MSEAGDWDPGPWKGHDFKSAKQKYDIHVGRSYSDAVKKSVNPDKLVPVELVTESKAPLVVACDVTGSMGESPATIFSKCPYLDLEGKEYLGDDLEISFAAIGDAYSDNYPLQVRPFVKGLDLKKELEELIIEGGGGGQSMETYELGALYYANHVKMPNALNPIIIFIGDEGLYEFVDTAQAKRWTRTNLEKRTSYADVLRALQQKFAVYCIRQPYSKTGGDKMSSADMKIHKQWADVLGEDHMAFLPNAERIVDVIFGILAKETGKIKYFQEEITQRQKPDQVKTAMKGLHTILGISSPDSKDTTSAKSVTTTTKSTTKTSKPLISKGIKTPGKTGTTSMKKLIDAPPEDKKPTDVSGKVSAGTKKTTTAARKAAPGRKKTTDTSKKVVAGTKKTTAPSKKTAGTKKTTAPSKKTAGTKKTTTASKKTTATKKTTTDAKKTAGTKKTTAASKKTADTKKTTAPSKKTTATKKTTAAPNKTAGTKKTTTDANKTAGTKKTTAASKKTTATKKTTTDAKKTPARTKKTAAASKKEKTATRKDTSTPKKKSPSKKSKK
ncbi:MAG: hypothetical protein JXJ04_15980 [Spirochaetales bacterium]|nr:hypothetical protein [Spirochaetales bacterium]